MWQLFLALSYKPNTLIDFIGSNVSPKVTRVLYGLVSRLICLVLISLIAPLALSLAYALSELLLSRIIN
jgi:hypothetical protein